MLITYMEMENSYKITLNHGSGGKMMHELIDSVFLNSFSNGKMIQQTDSAIIKNASTHHAFTTDSFVVDPIFFPGGDIGKLAVCGTVNDLAVSGAIPEYLSCGFILEEGLELGELLIIVHSMAATARVAGVTIVTGDTKVVPKEKCDKLFINTSGIGRVSDENLELGTGNLVEVGDVVILNGGIAEHGMAILCEREGINFHSGIESDCAPLNHLIHEILSNDHGITFMRDATRGGVATVLCELSKSRKLGVEIWENEISIRENVASACEILGFDPLYVANEGKFISVVKAGKAGQVLEKMKAHELGREAKIIGKVVDNNPGLVVLETSIGGKRVIEPLAGEQLPRIC